MKKLLFVFLTLCLSSLFAELYPARRYVELGYTEALRVSQNAMPMADIFKKNLVLDLKKISKGMPKSGFAFAFEDNSALNLDFNFSRFAFGFHIDSQFSGRLNISKSLFDVLAEGVSPGKTYTADANFWSESFVSFSVPVRFNVGKVRVRLSPSWFSPIYYVPSTKITCSAINGNDGSLRLTASAPIEVYTVTEFKGLVNDGKLSGDFVDKIKDDDLARSFAQSAGIDLAALVEYPLLDTLDIGGYANIPIVPARLKHKVTGTASLSVSTDSLIKVAFDDSKMEHSADISDVAYSGANYLVNRPLRLGAECAWRPVGKWLTMRAAAGFAMRNPFGADFSAKSVYPEYKLGLEIVGIGMFGLGLSTEYTKKVFAHAVGIMLNFRAIEFDISAAVCSPTFVQSFKGEGVAAALGVKLGW